MYKKELSKRTLRLAPKQSFFQTQIDTVTKRTNKDHFN